MTSVNELDPAASGLSLTDEVALLLDDCYDDPDLFNSCVLGRNEFYWRQEEMAASVVDYRITVCYSGNAIGKDYLVAGLIPWWLWTRPDSLVIVTGPGQTLLGTVTWKELRRAMRNSLIPLPCHVSEGAKTSPQTVIIESGWQALGYSTTTVERASGQHAENLLVIVEEASGVEEDTWNAIDALKFDRMVAIGNPIRPDGRFVDLIRQADRDRQDGRSPHLSVNAIQVPSTDSPHADQEKSEWGLADQTWLNDCFRRYGKESLWCASHVFARIPESASECLIPEAWLDYATAVARGAGAPIAPRLAIDLGEGVGRDASVILVRDELGVLEVWCSNVHGLAETAYQAARLAEKWRVPPSRCSWDKMGIGRDFDDHLYREGLRGALPYGAESSPREPTGFTNMRSEAAWSLRRRLNPEGIPAGRDALTGSMRPFHIPAGTFWPRLRQELKVLDYSMQGKKIKLLEKERWKDRLGHSPDCADALIQSFAL